MNTKVIALVKIIVDWFKKPISKIIHILPHGIISWGSLYIVLFSIALLICRTDIINLYIDSFGQWIGKTYSYIDERPALNLLIAFLLLIIGMKIFLSMYRSKLCSNTLFSLCIVSIGFINSWPNTYLNIIGQFSYLWLLNIILVSFLLLEVYVLVLYVIRTKPKTHNSGLLIQSPDYIADGRKVYAETISELVINSPIREKSFAVGIVGEWGAGKTIVLSEIEQLLKDKAIVIKFKPWNSKSPESLIDDFFTVLRKGINSNNANIGNIIKRYAAHIIDMDVNQGLSVLAKIGSITTNEIITLDSLKDDVQKIISNLDKNVVILIDDLDRLDSDELFETLRLIRNTADFNNVAYVVTYDRDYVCRMLEGKGIVNSERYLEKIFTTSISLPTYEPYILVLLVYKELKKRYGEDSIEFKGLSNYITFTWSGKSNYILNDYIKTYRDAIRFTNHIIQDLEILKRNSATYSLDLNMKEWFHLELLKFSYPKEYLNLRNLPNEHLEVVYDSSQYGYVRIKKPSKDQTVNEIQTPFDSILTLIFEGNNFKPNSISYEHNYYNYFALRVLSTEIKQSEFNNLFDDISLDMDYVLRLWKGRNPSVNKSVAAHFSNYDKRNCNLSQGKRFIKAMLKWGTLTCDTRMIRVAANISMFDFKKNMQTELCRTFYEELIAILPTIDNIEYACSLAMASAPGPFDPSEDPDLPDRNMLSREDAEALAAIIFDTLAANKPNDVTIDKLAVADSTIRVLLEKLTIETTIQDYPAFEHYVLGHIIEYFDNLIKTSPENKGSNLKEFVKHLEPELTDDESINEHIAEEYRYRLMKIFGESDNIKHIINNWFDATDDDKQKAIAQLV